MRLTALAGTRSRIDCLTASRRRASFGCLIGSLSSRLAGLLSSYLAGFVFLVAALAEECFRIVSRDLFPARRIRLISLSTVVAEERFVGIYGLVFSLVALAKMRRWFSFDGS